MAEKAITEIAAAMDRNLTDVMPDTWAGHGRLVIAETDLSEKQETFARRLLERMAEKRKYPAEKAAKAAIAEARDRL